MDQEVQRLLQRRKRTKNTLILREESLKKRTPAELWAEKIISEHNDIILNKYCSITTFRVRNFDFTALSGYLFQIRKMINDKQLSEKKISRLKRKKENIYKPIVAKLMKKPFEEKTILRKKI